MILEKISVTEDVVLATLYNIKDDGESIVTMFEEIAKAGVNVDMISQSAPQGSGLSVSFSIGTEDMTKLVSLKPKLSALGSDVRLMLNNGNTKLSVYGEAMKTHPGVAAAVFRAVVSTGAAIKLITTSEVDISMLISKLDYQLLHDRLHNIEI